jgi:OOP family OmpA-OmpF porin
MTMNDMKARLGAIAAGAGLLLGLCGTGCDGVRPVPVSCHWLDDAAGQIPDAGKARDDTAVLIDASASFWPKDGNSKKLPVDPAAIATAGLLTDFGAPGDRLVSLGTFDGSSTSVSWQLSDVSLPQATGSDRGVAQQEKGVRGCLSRPVSAAVDATPQVAGSDVLAALAGAGRQLDGAPAAHRHVIIITDGLSNAGCLDLRSVLTGGARPSDIVAGCPAKGELAMLKGVDVRLVGIGFQALAKPMPTNQHSWLKNFWHDMCAALAVRSVDSCVTSQTGNGVRASHVARPDDPQITFPPVTPVLEIPEALLFAYDSAGLNATAKSYLDVLAEQVKGQGARVTQVIGHTDSRGTDQHNADLSTGRAMAVRGYLATLGFDGVAAKGVGSSEPKCEEHPGGRANEACMARDRRVEIKLGGLTDAR